MLIRPERSLLVVSNMQEGIVPAMDGDGSVLWNVCWLASLARKLEIPIMVMEHKRLLGTVPEVRALTEGATYREIITFSYVEDPSSRAEILRFGRDQLILCGTETHISVLQSAADAKKEGWHPFVVAEACAARCRDDHRVAVDRMRGNGIDIVTREMVFFEWFRSSEDPRYIESSIAFLKHPHIFPLPEHRAQ